MLSGKYKPMTKNRILVVRYAKFARCLATVHSAIYHLQSGDIQITHDVPVGVDDATVGVPGHWWKRRIVTIPRDLGVGVSCYRAREL